MKKILFAALSATVLFASCAKDDSQGNNNVSGEKAKMTISFNNPAGTRALDDAVETVIKNATAFVLSADGAIMKKFFISTGEINDGTEYEVTTAADKVLVIANKDLTATTATTLIALKTEVTALSALDGATNGFYASGTSAVLEFDQTASDGTSDLAETTVTMKLLPARLDVNVTNNMDNYGDLGALVVEDVAVLYSGGYSHWVAATENGIDFAPAIGTISAISGGKYYNSGFDGWDTDLSSQNFVNANLLKTWTTPASADFAESFYVYPPAAGAYSKYTILVVRGTYNSDPIYFPVHLDGTDAAALQSGKKYTLNIDLTGDAMLGGGGVEDPETPVVKAYVKVTVSIDPWESVAPIDKEFN